MNNWRLAKGIAHVAGVWAAFISTPILVVVGIWYFFGMKVLQSFILLLAWLFLGFAWYSFAWGVENI